jgi:hypothetical protein
MTKQLKIIFCFLFFVFCLKSQINLVPNPSFEIYTSCPNSAGQIDFASPWFQPGTGTPDYFNSCASAMNFVNVPVTFMGNSFAHNGVGMAGELFYDNVSASSLIYREYLAVKLSSTLSNNQKYYISYYLKLADSSRYATDAISVLFTTDSIHKNSYDTISRVPQINNQPGNFILDKSNWTKMRGSFTSSGTENYMYIGNFEPQKTNDTLFVGGGGSMQYNNFPYYYFDDICVSTDSLFSENWVNNITSVSNSNVRLFPIPTSRFLYIEGFSVYHEYKIYNIFGEEMKCEHKYAFFDLMGLESGFYFIHISISGDNPVIYKIIKQ